MPVRLENLELGIGNLEFVHIPTSRFLIPSFRGPRAPAAARRGRSRRDTCGTAPHASCRNAGGPLHRAKRRRRDDLRHHPFESVRLLERGLRQLGQLPLALVGVEDDRSILGAVIAELARASVGSMLSSWSRRRSNADRAAHAGAAEAAISVRVLREVLLM